MAEEFKEALPLVVPTKTPSDLFPDPERDRIQKQQEAILREFISPSQKKDDDG